ncbi:MAG: hypothetical protein ACKO7W_13335 [Elainella sp.]
MAFFNPEIPLLSRKPAAGDLSATAQVWRVQCQVGAFTLWSAFYTRHDQACLNWGLLTASIFAIAQFVPLSWITQAIMASALTGLGCGAMAWLTWRYTAVEQLAWILYSWLGLMLLGTVITDLSLWCSWSRIVMEICPLWLGICDVGYLITGLGMRSRLILLCSGLHILTIGLLPYVGGWQPLLTGLVISGSALVLAELQWDSNGVCNYRTLESLC